MISAFSLRWGGWVALPLLASAIPLLRDGRWSVAVAVAAVAVLAAVAAARLRDFDAPYAANLENLPRRRTRKPTISRRGKAIILAVLVVNVVAAAFSAPMILCSMLVLVGLSAGLTLARPLSSYVKNRRQIRHAIEVYAPVVALPYAGHVFFHIPMWTPYVKRSELPYVVIASNHARFKTMSATLGDPIMAPAKNTTWGQTFPTSVRVALYVHNAGRNDRFLARPGIQHVFVGHGESDKPGSASVSIDRYDVILSAGQANIDRFAAAGVNIEAEKFHIIGRPQSVDFSTVSRPISEASRPVVLYAPTWPHQEIDKNLSSVFLGESIVEALLERGHTVMFRRHPAGRFNDEGEAAIERINALIACDVAATGRSHLWGDQAMEMPLAAIFNASDAMITDVSGIAADYLATLKPLAMVAAQTAELDPLDTDSVTEKFRARHALGRAAYVIEPDLESLATTLRQMFGADPLQTARTEQHRYYLGGLTGAESATTFVDFLQTSVR